jgi:hypothetical protein
MSQHHLPHPSKTPGSPPVLEAPLDNRSVLGNGALRSKNRFVSLVTLTQARGQGQTVEVHSNRWQTVVLCVARVLR